MFIIESPCDWVGLEINLGGKTLCRGTQMDVMI